MNQKVISFDQVDLVFGSSPEKAFSLLDAGETTQHIRRTTSQVVGVRRVSLDICQGEIFVLMGLSGSGKSSLLRCINGLNRPSRGDVSYHLNANKLSLNSMTSQQLRKLRTDSIAMVFQQVALMPWRTVGDNVALPLEYSRTPKNEIHRRVKDSLRLVGLESWLEKYPDQLSGGMQQRVGIARALVTDCDILLMDEPFSALDPIFRDELQDEILDLHQKLNKTIVFVSHDFNESIKIADRIGIMDGGSLITVNSPDGLLEEAGVSRWQTESKNPIHIVDKSNRSLGVVQGNCILNQIIPQGTKMSRQGLV